MKKQSTYIMDNSDFMKISDVNSTNPFVSERLKYGLEIKPKF